MKKSKKKTILLIAIPLALLLILGGVYAYSRSCAAQSCDTEDVSDTDYAAYEALFGGSAKYNRGSRTGKCPNGLLSALWSGKSAASYGE